MSIAEAGQAGQPVKPSRDVYEAGTGRKIAFSIVFLLLLPFFVSLGPMLFWRVSQNQWLGTPGLIVLAVAFAAIMLLLVVELLFSIRSRVAFGEDAVEVTLPSGRGATPALRYIDTKIPYDQVKSVEIRREVYGGTIAPVTMKGARVILKDGDPVKLGYVNEANVDPALPFVEIGEKIAARAGAPIHDVGVVHRSLRRKMRGQKATEEQLKPITEDEIAAINKRHDQMMMAVVGVIVVMIGLGIVSDRDHRLIDRLKPDAPVSEAADATKSR